MPSSDAMSADSGPSQTPGAMAGSASISGSRPQPGTARRRLCSIDELERGTARRFNVGEQRIALVRIGDRVYAVGDRCTHQAHQDVSLADGEVFEAEAEIECARHGSTFSLITGEPRCLPATEATPVFPVEVIGGDVFIDLDG